MAASSGEGRPLDGPSEVFARARAALERVRLRPEIVRAAVPAPKRLAPYALALSAELYPTASVARQVQAAAASGAPGVGGYEEAEPETLATGRLVVLYDPQGHDAWQGSFRVVTYVRASLDAEMAADPVLGGVGWSWLLEALGAHRVGYTAAGGTVTRVASESFGALAGEVFAGEVSAGEMSAGEMSAGEMSAGEMLKAEIEVRASWTATDDDLGAHLEAWAELLAQVGGLPPVTAGVLPLPRRGPVETAPRTP